MNNHTQSKLHTARLKALLATGALLAGLGLVATSANATPLTATVGGVPTGATIYENFDDCSGSAQCITSNGITVNFNPDASAVSGAGTNYAPPYVSGNGGLFGDFTVNGPDSTTYLTTGSTGSSPGASVELLLPGLEKYMGLLWGSVDAYNTLTFYNDGIEIISFTGGDVSTLAGLGNCVGGNQGMLGTCYVNINLTQGFNRVVATSSEYAFEFDNVAFNSQAIGVPEPGTAGVFLLGLLLLGSACWFKRRQYRED